jgi:hypothetical protein
LSRRLFTTVVHRRGSAPARTSFPQQIDMYNQLHSDVVWSDVLFFVAIILAQFIINDSWLYAKLGWLDSWMYIGYAHHYTDPSFLNDNYRFPACHGS